MKTKRRLLSKKNLLDIFLKHRVDSPFPGDWESIFKGEGFEFWGLRKLERTDSFKNIDWKSTAKTGEYYVREYLAESYFNLMLLYDISKSVSFGRKELLQANIAVSLAYSAIVSNNGCGLIMFSDDVITYIPPCMGWTHFMQILTAIAEVEPAACQETNINPALRKLVHELPESLTFILSDFLYPFHCDFSFQRITHGTNKHEVRALRILEDFESRLPADSRGLMPLYDYETGETILADLNKWESFNADMKRQMEETRRHLNKAGIDMLTITPEEDFSQKINAFVQMQC
jgi:uncharacterized protein (DUF58 family)